MTKQSDATVQVEAEALIREKVAERLDKKLEAKRVTLASGPSMQVDGVADDGSAFVEIFAHQGALKGGQRHKVAQDALKLVTLGQSHPGADLILAFCDAAAAAYATKGTWLAAALATWNVQVLVVDLDQSVRDRIRAAQVRQEMINPPVPPDTASEQD